MINAVIGRYAEIFLKRNRKQFFLRVLRQNLRRALSHIPDLVVTTPYNRVMVTRTPLADGTYPLLGPDAARIEDAMQRVFGLASMSQAALTSNDFDNLSQMVVSLFRERVERQGMPRTFRITSTRADKRYPIRSDELNRRLGGSILEVFPDLKVELTTPDANVGVEIRPEYTCVFADTTRGPGGLPVGSNGRALLLLSGGIDSPVAGIRTMKRGVQVDAVYFHSFPYTSDQAKEKVVELARVLSRWQPSMTLFVVPFAHFQEACRDNAPAKSLVLLYRRMMVRMAQAISDDLGYAALVTGESIGQVASQTLPNLACVGAVATRPIIRPLIANDKNETIDFAKQFGTFEISIQPFDDCCSLFVARHPELSGSPRHLDAVESKLDLDTHLRAALSQMDRLEIARAR